LPFRLEVRQQREVQLAVPGERRVAPDSIDGDTEELGAEARELFTDLVVKRHLVAADGAPIGRIEGQDHRPPAELRQRDLLVRRARQREVGSGRSHGERRGRLHSSTSLIHRVTAASSRRRGSGGTLDRISGFACRTYTPRTTRLQERPLGSGRGGAGPGGVTAGRSATSLCGWP